jgi:outer membrane lipoprotein carrier protein
MFSLSVMAATTSSWESVAQRYRAVPLAEMDVTKTVKSDFSGEKVLSGKMFLGRGLFRMDIASPEKSTIVFDGKNLWSEQAPSADFGGPVQVTKMKVGKKSDTQLLVTKVFEKGVLQKLFKIESEKTVEDEKYKKNITLIKARPQTKELNITLLILGIDPDKKEVTEIGYVDDIGNQTIMKFSNVKLSSTADKSIFKYQPPKGAQVTNL